MMIDYRNPYTPGAGAMPKYLAGREEILDDAKNQLMALSEGYQTRSVAFYGLRGVGKTVLLNSVEALAEEIGVLVRHVEVEERKGLIAPLASMTSSVTRVLSKKELLKGKIEQLKNLFMSFTLSVNPDDCSLSVGLDEQKLFEQLSQSENLSNDFTNLFVLMGRYAQAANSSVCFCIDELQYAKKNELEALTCALHRSAQLGLPILVYCAGLPKLLKQLGEAKTYTERLFNYIHVDSLPPEKAVDAIIKPASKLDVTYESEAISEILDYSEGYPYFIQELCSTIWSESNSKIVSAKIAHACIKATDSRLDEGFFSVRYNRCPPKQREFLIAMVKCGELPCTLVNVARIMNREVSSIGPLRAQLISRGIIYSTGRGEVDFTVPHFDKFLTRIEHL